MNYPLLVRVKTYEKDTESARQKADFQSLESQSHGDKMRAAAAGSSAAAARRPEWDLARHALICAEQQQSKIAGSAYPQRNQSNY